MKLFPLYMNIEDKTFLVVGGGDVARRKVEKLLEFTDNIIVIAPETEMKPVGDMRILHREYERGDLDMADFVIAATDHRNLNAEIANDAIAAGKLVNSVDDPEACTFVFPGIVKRGDLTVAVSSGGSSPSATQYACHEIDEVLPKILDPIVDRMGKLRQVVPKFVSDQQIRSKLYHEIFQTLLETENRASDDVIAAMIRRYARNDVNAVHRGEGNAEDVDL